MERLAQIKKLSEKDKVWDIVVVGGGATGLGVAVDAATRGMSVALLEKTDFAKCTSSRSTKLVHGGVRYLQKGDVMLVDPMQYILLSKGTAKQDWSIHVEFLTDQNCFRMVFRCNGAPKVTQPLKIKNSAKTRSPFVALAART